jgi:tetratricopeptide (TPR) repeat protein
MKRQRTDEPWRPWRGPVFFLAAGCVALMAVVLLVYAPVRHFDYVDFDDGVFVSGNSHVLSGLSASNAWWAVTWTQGGSWHPVTWWSLMLDSTLFGAKPAVYHLVNIGLHGANAGLLFLVFFSLTGARWKSLIAAACFALHPLRVESVAWITERKDVLAGFFLLPALLAYLRYVRTQRGRWLLAGGLLYTLSMMAKALAPAFPLLLWLLDAWPLDRWARASRREKFRMVLEKAALAVPAAGVGLWVVYAAWKAGTVAPVADTSILSRVALLGLSSFRYLAQTIWPVNLSFFYPYESLVAGRPEKLGAFLGLILLTAGAWRLRRRAPWLITGWGWYLLTLLPVSGLLRLGGVAFADHYTYLPHMGLWFGLVWGVASVPVPARAAWRRALGTVVLVAALAAMVVATRRQMAFWRNSETLFERALQVDPRNELALTNVGALRAQQGKVREALDYFERAMALGSREAVLYFNAGNAYFNLGDYSRAEAAFAAALTHDPSFVEAGENLGLLYAQQGRWEEAIHCLQAACRLKPDDEKLAGLLNAVLRQAQQNQGR